SAIRRGHLSPHAGLSRVVGHGPGVARRHRKLRERPFAIDRSAFRVAIPVPYPVIPLRETWTIVVCGDGILAQVVAAIVEQVVVGRVGFYLEYLPPTRIFEIEVRVISQLYSRQRFNRVIVLGTINGLTREVCIDRFVGVFKSSPVMWRRVGGRIPDLGDGSQP